jgi:hypothetical protein
VKSSITSTHKINCYIGRVLLARRMGKKRIIARAKRRAHARHATVADARLGMCDFSWALRASTASKPMAVSHGTGRHRGGVRHWHP